MVDGVFIASDISEHENQIQTNEAFSEKWLKYNNEENEKQERLFEFQRNWYLKLYGFQSEEELKQYLEKQSVVLDAGCGLGYKAKWFADLSPGTLIIGMDYSDAVFAAKQKYTNTENLVFVKGDIADTKIIDGVVSYVSCDQVLHHTEDPQETIYELYRILCEGGELAVYVYAKKALPRELLDSYFRKRTKNISSNEMWKLSEQLTELGKRLSEMRKDFDVPDIPLLGIKGGRMSVQRFLYWNFIKCFWNANLGWETSVSTNYDWYAPSNAERYSQEEFLMMLSNVGLRQEFIHTEEACHSGRFVKD